MAIKTILVPLEGSQSGVAVLECALAAARTLGAHLEAVHVKTDPREMFPFVSEPASAGSIELVIEAAEKGAAERAARARALFDGFCDDRGIAVASAPPAPDEVFAMWHEETGIEGEVVARRGRLADLIAVARPAENEPAPAILETALLETGRPVLVAPPAAPSRFGSNIAVAWNDSAQAARTIAAALPVFAAAETVTVVTVEGNHEAMAAPADVSAHLAWHGINASTRTVAAGTRDAGEVLLAEAAALGADLLVMGGYGHSRMREVIFGGVTYHVLGATTIPVLMAH